MIRYSIDKNFRTYVYFSIAFLSIFISPHVSFLEKIIGYRLSITPFMLFCIILWIFNRYLWSLPVFSFLFKVPNLNGKWEGTITLPITDNREKEETLNVVLLVTQNWNTIDFVLKGPGTVSTASIAYISINNPKNIIVKWVYQVKDRTGLSSTNQSGEGVTELSLIADSNIPQLEGHYYSNLGRKGNLKVSKVL